MRFAILIFVYLLGSSGQARAKPDKGNSTAPGSSSLVYAAWYPVPPRSLARRRAGKNEFTAAHNRLALGTLVRVTNVTNKKSVVVRITDRGITSRRCKIDVCKEAAEKIDMVRTGITQVRLDVLSTPPAPRKVATKPSKGGSSPAPPSSP